MQEGLDDAGNLVLRSIETGELERVPIKDFNIAYKEGTVGIYYSGLENSFKNVENVNAPTTISEARDRTLASMETTKFEGSDLELINQKLGTNLRIEESTGRIVGTPEDIETLDNALKSGICP